MENTNVSGDVGVAGVLDRAAAVPVEHYHPARVMEAVNACVPLGREAALEALDASRVRQEPAGGGVGLLWVMRALFEMPPGIPFPPVRIGQPSPGAPKAAGIWPRFPMVMIHGVPFLATCRFVLGGKAEPLAVSLATYRSFGSLRQRRIVLPGSLHGFEEDFVTDWIAAYGETGPPPELAGFREQLARLRRAVGNG